jgi:hypothetical protein
MAATFIPNYPISGPWSIESNDCIGDSLGYINANTNYLGVQIANTNTALAAASATLDTKIDTVSASSGILLQQAYNQNNNFTTIVYSDTNNLIDVNADAIPASTAGTLLLTTNSTPITPRSLNNYFLIQYTISKGFNINQPGLISLLTRTINGTTETDVLYCAGDETRNIWSTSMHTGMIRLPVTTLAPTSFQVRAGLLLNYVPGNVFINGSTQTNTGNRNLGGARISTLLVQEIKG